MAALSARGIEWTAPADEFEIVVAKSDEPIVDSIVEVVTGEAPRVVTDDDEIGYGTSEWSSDQHRAITELLGAEGIRWWIDGSELVVSRTNESQVDSIVASVTGDTPVLNPGPHGDPGHSARS